jgi:transposase
LLAPLAYAVEAGEDLIPLRLQWWLDKVFGLARGLTELAASILARKRCELEQDLGCHPEGTRHLRPHLGTPESDAAGARPTPDLRAFSGKVDVTNTSASAICGQR